MKAIPTQDQIERAKKLADLRNTQKSKDGVQSRRWTNDKTDWDIHYEGALAEVIVSDYLNASLDLTYKKYGDHHAPDLSIHGITSLEVKWVGFKDPILKFNHPSEFKAQFAVVVCPDEIYGFIEKNQFLESCYIRNFNYGKRYCVKSNQLWPIEYLIDYINKKKSLLRLIHVQAI